MKVPTGLVLAEGSLPWLADGCLLTVSSHGRERALGPLPHLIKALTLLDQGPTIMTLFYPITS